jgi:hypothetical protein
MEIIKKIIYYSFGSGIAEGRDLKDESFNLAQMPNRSKND